MVTVESDLSISGRLNKTRPPYGNITICTGQRNSIDAFAEIDERVVVDTCECE